MLELKKGCHVPFPEKLFEQYEIQGNAIYANVNASKVLGMMRHFIEIHDEPLFFVLELPCKDEDGITESKMIANAADDTDVFFVDNLNAEKVSEWLDALGDFLVDDGMNIFGVGAHESREELLFGKYNFMTLYTIYLEKYHDFFEKFGIERTERLVTAWDTFDHDHPGECILLHHPKTGKTVYDIPEMYKEYGMYFYKSRKTYDESCEKPITFEELVGKILLVGMTYYTKDEQPIEQKQFYGIVIQADESIIRFTQKDGTEFSLPPDLSSAKRARPGEYRLRSTGEIVVNPDFLVTWNVVAND